MKNAKALVAVAALVVAVGWLFVSLTGTGDEPQATGTVSPTATVVSDGRSTDSGLPTVRLANLPLEAQQTHALILEGGPFEYSQDGQVFGNRERILPQKDYGWYREYTVETPGSDDRGARRFVVGEDQVFFYTDDHYDSFSEVTT